MNSSYSPYNTTMNTSNSLYTSTNFNSSHQDNEDHEKVELFLSCKNLKNMDYFSLTDPQIRVFLLVDCQEILIGETEVISDNLNPKFSKSIIMDYIFEAKQQIRFQVVDIDEPQQRTPVGDVYTTLGAIVGSRNQSATFEIKNGQEVCGELTINAEKVGQANWTACFEIQGLKLKNQHGWFLTSSPYFKLGKSASLGAQNLVTYESEIVRGNLSPRWEAFEVSLQKLCNGDRKKPIVLEVYTRRIFQEILIGQCTFTIEDLLEQRANSFWLTRPTEEGGFGYISIKKFEIYEKLGFLDYLKAGVQLNMTVAIDFTASNGLPDSPGSLHAINPYGQQNQYQKAIQSVGEILLCYDYDQIVTVYGFGGVISGSKYGHASHCFALSGDDNNPYAVGLNQVLGQYENALRKVHLSGPTYFSRILKESIFKARKNKENGSSEYLVVLILTDGIIHDMEETIDCLIEAAYLPLSVIIVGVGDADFSQMEVLDGDKGLYNKKGQKVPRDLVQFVPFNEFKGDREKLASEVLQEVPSQLAIYMKDAKIRLPGQEKRGDFGAGAGVIEEEIMMRSQQQQGGGGFDGDNNNNVGFDPYAPSISEISHVGVGSG